MTLCAHRFILHTVAEPRHAEVLAQAENDRRVRQAAGHIGPRFQRAEPAHAADRHQETGPAARGHPPDPVTPWIDPHELSIGEKETPTVDHDTFDALTRTAATDGGTRRTLLRLLAGSALGAVAARLGLAEEAAAKAKQHKGKAKRKHHLAPSQPDQADHAAAKSPGHPASSGVQSERKRRHHHKPPPLPPGCEDCTECQMCKDGACVRDPDLERVRCQGSGATCGYCQGGVCTPSDQRPCDDGVCPRKGQCCSGEKWCEDPESSTGFACVGETDCCPARRSVATAVA